MNFSLDSQGNKIITIAPIFFAVVGILHSGRPRLVFDQREPLARCYFTNSPSWLQARLRRWSKTKPLDLRSIVFLN